LAVLDVDFEMGVPWTKPDDLDIEGFDQGGAIGYLRVEGFNAAFFDGSVRFLSSSMDMDLLRALMTRAGGEQVPYLP
jgi:prepilin-type processing-associated H-X9-DG protein